MTRKEGSHEPRRHRPDQHHLGGALLGEHRGQLLAIGWPVTVGALALRTGMLPRWVGWTGLVASALYLTGQGDILATAVPGFPVWDLGGLLGSTLWGLWVLAVGAAVLRRPALSPRSARRATRRSRRRPRRASGRVPDLPFRVR
jgi:Domain of unknown function (DUF4386)